MIGFIGATTTALEQSINSDSHLLSQLLPSKIGNFKGLRARIDP